MKHNEHGLTLVELLVAILITALIALAAFQAIKTSGDAGEQVARVSSEMAAAQQAIQLLGDDFQHYVPRDILNEFGVQEASIQGGYDAVKIVELTRNGVYRSDRQYQSGLARVAYRLVDDELWRDQWWQIDRVDEEPKQSVKLLEDVSQFEILYFERQSGRVNEYERWGTETDEQGAFLAPLAVEIRLTQATIGEVKRIVLLSR